MTLSELRTLAERDAVSTDSRRRTAGQYAKKALEALEKKDWTGAIVALAKAIAKREEYVDGLEVVDRAKKASFKTTARAAASRANGAKGGRPRKYPYGWRASRQSTRKPGETRGRKPKAQGQDNEKKTEE